MKIPQSEDLTLKVDSFFSRLDFLELAALPEVKTPSDDSWYDDDVVGGGIGSLIHASRSSPSGTGTLRWALGATGFNSPSKSELNSYMRACDPRRRSSKVEVGDCSDSRSSRNYLGLLMIWWALN